MLRELSVTFEFLLDWPPLLAERLNTFAIPEANLPKLEPLTGEAFYWPSKRFSPSELSLGGAFRLPFAPRLLLVCFEEVLEDFSDGRYFLIQEIYTFICFWL